MRSYLQLMAGVGLSVGSAFMVDSNLSTITVALVTTVVMVVAVINFVEKKIEKKWQSYSELQDAKYELLRSEIEHLREAVENSHACPARHNREVR